MDEYDIITIGIIILLVGLIIIGIMSIVRL